jgi:hypothetical protein
MDMKRRRFRPVTTGGSTYRERRSDRVPVDDSTQLRHRYAIEIKIRDVSTRGFMAECGESVEIGSKVSLDVPGIGAVQAQVRWQIGSRMGGMFLDPISLEKCEWVAVRAEEASLEPC